MIQVGDVNCEHTVRKKLSFPLRIYSVNVTKSAVFSFLRIWSHFLKKSLMENFIFCVVVFAWDGKRIMHVYEGKDIGKHEGTCTCVGKNETAHDSTVGKDEDGYHSA